MQVYKIYPTPEGDAYIPTNIHFPTVAALKADMQERHELYESYSWILLPEARNTPEKLTLVTKAEYTVISDADNKKEAEVSNASK